MRGLKRHAFVAAALLLAGLAAPAALGQSDYPSRPVRLIVGFIPGSSADITARVLGQRMGQILGQQFVVEGKPGAGSSLAAEFVARAPKEGYTLFIASSANITNAAINPNLPFDIGKDFAPIALINTAAVILVVHPSTGVNTVQELIALAKSKPGEILYASTGVGTAPHLSGELLSMRAGLKLVHVPYQGSPQAATDLLAGRVAMMFSPASAVVSQVEAGSLKVLASAATKRPGILPKVPTMAEAGMPDFDTSIWFGLMAPAGTPRPVIDKLAGAVREALASNEVVTAWRPQGIDPLSGGPEDFARHIASESKRWGDVATAAGLKK
jgi:tripartite-type tricarboxylate transporter receptor subunit TctC